MSPLRIEYNVRFADFLVSLRAYRKRSLLVRLIYALDVWILPTLGALLVAFYAYGWLTHDVSITRDLVWLAIVGAAAMVILPLIYRLRLRWTYRQRTSLSPDGRVLAELDETAVRFRIADKVDVRYEWAAFSDYAEEKGVLTLFVKKASLNTIPKRDLTEAQWTVLLALVSRKLPRR